MLIQEQHNRLMNKIGKELKNNLLEGKVQIERTWRRGRDLVKPDNCGRQKRRSLCYHQSYLPL